MMLSFDDREISAAGLEGGEILLRAEKLTKHFRTAKRKIVQAVSEVDLAVYRGETLALVGESGCGKSTLARTLIHLIRPTSGSVFYKGQEISAMKEKEFKPIGRNMQMVFQDPYASLDPRMTVRDIIAEPLVTHSVCSSKKETTELVLTLMERVGVPGEFLMRYPHQFSGGQRQRIGIARAIALNPELLICDEPVSALDVSVQSQVLNLLKKLKIDMNLTTVFIGHDLSVIHFIADRVAVMFLGRICEIAKKEELFSRPLHPYTGYLLNAIPLADPHLRGKERIVLKGEIPSPVNPPSGCCFRTRCPYADELCAKVRPELTDKGDGHLTACHHV